MSQRPTESSLSPAQLRSAVALAEAIIPGSRTIPAADEALVLRAEQVLAELSPHLVTAWAGAQRALDAASIAQKGRSFHALDSEAQQALLAKWQRDPVLRGPLAVLAFAYKFLHFDRPEVYAAMGGKLNVVKNLEQPRWLGQITRADDWVGDDDVECEVVVVGTGAGGAVVGRELAERGFAVCFVEEGEHRRRDEFTGSSLFAHGELYRGGMAFGNAIFPVFMGRLVGGSTAVNGGTCFRTPPWVLDRWCEDLGTAELTPDAMAPYFDRVEEILQVQPAAREHIGPVADVFSRGCDAHGWSHFAIRRNAPGCEGAGFCDFGCRTDARRSTNISYIPPALEKGAMLLTGLRARRVLIENGRAVGIEGVSKHGKRLRVRGQCVVFAGGAIPTPLFLLEQGICNESGEVGRNLSLHPSAGLSARFDGLIEGHKHIPQGYGCDEFLKDGLLLTAAQPDANISAVVFSAMGQPLMEALRQRDHIATFGILIKDSAQHGVVRRDVGGHAVITYNVPERDRALLQRGVGLMGDIALAAGARELYPAIIGEPSLKGRSELEKFKARTVDASQFLLTSYHPLGTCKMGRDPETSVVDLDHQAHSVPGLYIVDGSTVPTSTGVNPQITIMAMATRAAVRIAAHLGYSEPVAQRPSEARLSV